ncbi:MAG: CatB-related O-acetyltransferase [Chlamydiales bacterium]|nr:CatB-related O-acetyltransferase [Chlamydiales bacterium]
MLFYKKIIPFLFIFCGYFSLLSADGLVEKGRGSYGNPTVFSWGEGARLRIGNFCSIANEVQVFLGGEHRSDWVTTYPFSTLWPRVAGHISGHPRTKGDVVIEHDVWIGLGACILSGVTIGSGAVVGARAVVTKNVPPYAIVAGNPAKIIRYRFDEEVIGKLLQIAWWNWSDRKISSAMEYLLSDDIYRFIERYE